MQQLSREELNKTDKELLESILLKPLSILGEEEKAIIRARRQYLTATELEAYKSILSNGEATQGNKEEKDEVPPDEPKGEVVTPKSNSKQEEESDNPYNPENPESLT